MAILPTNRGISQDSDGHVVVTHVCRVMSTRHLHLYSGYHLYARHIDLEFPLYIEWVTP